ncbi:MAG: ABC transporter ATP-binding protein [Candidatus Woesearchaeota archaeon]
MTPAVQKTNKSRKALISLKDVWKIYQMGDVQVQALRGLTFDVFEGEFVAIMGPSGSGKSTAMNIIGCLDIPSKGTVKLDGVDVSTLSESRLAQIRGQKIGFIFQKFNLIPTMSALENVMLPMTFQNISKEQRAQKAKELLKLVDLHERVDHRPNELSGGQQQRVAIARSLAMDPPVILADEPTGNLDSKMGKIVMDFLQKLHKQGRTIVMVTHDENSAQFAQRIAYLSDGAIIKTTGGAKHNQTYD